ncbi:collagen alpha-1(XII) chain [Elysia marginata]|uniref:Collagen alpha-1(XII) chain n=1 Tax=Elysia marginata TaxID=1093978 RepID=A0AAV4IQY5_9GAST|nr:collagen alpha-1(XII) chain [Elysia marginata]
MFFFCVHLFKLRVIHAFVIFCVTCLPLECTAVTTATNVGDTNAMTSTTYNTDTAVSVPDTATTGVTGTDAMTSTAYTTPGAVLTTVTAASDVSDTDVITPTTYNTETDVSFPDTAATDVSGTTNDCGQDGKIDLVLLLDASGSVGSTDFREQADFLADLVAQFDVGPTKMQVAAATYDSYVNRQFYLNDYNDTKSVVEAIRRISYTGGSTATHLALNFTRHVLFADGNGQRKGVPKVVIIATDGGSDDRLKTQAEASKLKQEGVRVYPIAIGSGVVLSELQYMATDPSFVFEVDSFVKLQDFLPFLQNSLCMELRVSQRFVRDSVSGSKNSTFLTYFNSTSKAPYTTIAAAPATTIDDVSGTDAMVSTTDSTSATGPALVTATAAGDVIGTDTMIPTTYTTRTGVTVTVTDPPTDSDCGQDGKIDLVLLLDASGSVGSTNFIRQADFLADLVAQFDVGPTKMQVAAATYDSYVNSQFFLADYNDTQSVVDAIRNIQYTSGSTATHLALQYTREVLFADGNGHRNGVPKVVIIATDGDSNNRSKTESESLKLKQEGVRVYPIAIGSGVSLSELEYMATDPSFVFKVDSFNRLQDFLPVLQNSLCIELQISVNDSSSRSRNATFSTDVPSTLLAAYSTSGPATATGDVTVTDAMTSTAYVMGSAVPDTAVVGDVTGTTSDLKPTDSDCGQDGKIDLALLLDASGSVNYGDFIKQADFLADLVAQFDVGPTKMQVAAATFDSYVHREFFLDDYSDTQSVVDAIRNISYTGGGTSIDVALEYAREVLLADGNGHRKGIPKIVILATDGQSNRQRIEVEALKLKQEGVVVYVIAIGSGVVLSDLTYIATHPSYVFQVDSFGTLQNFLPLLQTSLCLGCQQHRSFDLALLLDASGSVSPSDFEKQATFVADLVHQFEIGPQTVQVAAIAFDHEVHSQFFLANYSDTASVVDAIRRIPYYGGGTSTHLALNYTMNVVFADGNGHRDGMPKSKCTPGTSICCCSFLSTRFV